MKLFIDHLRAVIAHFSTVAPTVKTEGLFREHFNTTENTRTFQSLLIGQSPTV